MKIVLLILISFDVLIHAVDHQLSVKIQQELQPDGAVSKYIRVTLWNTAPSSDDLDDHFKKFALLKLENYQFKYENSDFNEWNDITYERFLYIIYPEQQKILTIFVKVNFSDKQDPSLLTNFIKKVNIVLETYDLLKTKYVYNSYQIIAYIVAVLSLIFGLLAWLKLKRHEQQESVPSTYKQISSKSDYENEKNCQKELSD